ncbi:MAG: formylglycine-generating enzyme family protein [Verrucomicrobiota bacterium]
MPSLFKDTTITLFEGEEHELKLLYIPSGRFRMGSRGGNSDEEPRHWVEITEPFWLGETPVTQAQYAELVKLSGAGLDKFPSHFKPPQYTKDLRRPVENVSWDDCQSLLEHLRENSSLSAGRKLPDSYHLCLPTEAQWEYTCRAGTETDYYSGDGEAALAEVGWFLKNSGHQTHPVKEKRPNTYDLHDLHGNVWEWCMNKWGNKWSDQNETYTKHGYITMNPNEQDCGGRDARRVLRGGSWYYSAELCRSALRSWCPPGGRDWFSGVRLCLSSGPVKNNQASVGPEDAEAEDSADPASGGAEAPTNLGSEDPFARMKPPRSGSQKF